MKNPMKMHDKESYLLDLDRVVAIYSKAYIDQKLVSTGPWYWRKHEYKTIGDIYRIYIQFKRGSHYLKYSDEATFKEDYKSIQAAVFQIARNRAVSQFNSK